MNELKFDGKGKIYSMFRPSYPKMFIEYLHSGIGINKSSIIADIGSGTGILSKQLLDVGVKIYAVEPNTDMRNVAEFDLSGCKNFISVNATAENTTLDDNSVDFITVAQAFHWFDKTNFKEESKRILKPNGKVILVWNTRVLTNESVEDYEKIMRKHCPDFEGFSGSKQSALYNEIGVESENDLKKFFEGKYETKTFENDKTNNLESFIGGALSASYAPKVQDKNYSAFVDDLTACFGKHANNGKLMMPFTTRSYSGIV